MKRFKTKLLELFEIIEPHGIEKVKKEFDSKSNLYDDYCNAMIVVNCIANFLKDFPEKLGKNS